MATDYDFIFSTEKRDVQAAAFSPFSLILYVAIVVLVAVTAFLVGVMYERRTATANAPELGTFYEVWEILDRDFYGELPSSEERTYGAIAGLVSALNDPFTSFSPPEVATVRREELAGHFGGIGIVVRNNENRDVIVASIIPGNPAAEAGLETGDVIYEVDGQNVRGASTDVVAGLVRGEIGTDVTLLLYRPSTDETFTVTLKRAIIETPTVFSENEDGIGYVNLSTFNGVATSQMRDHLQSLQDQGVRALILDLRANGGGLLQQAVDIADLFLPEGVILTERTSEGDEDIFRSEDGDMAEEIPLVVLVDNGTASASEVVAGALQDRDRAILIGQRTYGKGVVQLVYNLVDGSQLRVTHAAWYTPDDRAITGDGLQPDLPVLELYSPAGDDLVLQAALDYLNENYPPEAQDE